MKVLLANGSPHRTYMLFRNLAVALPSVLLTVLGHPLALLEVMLVFTATVILALVFPVRPMPRSCSDALQATGGKRAVGSARPRDVRVGQCLL